MMKHILRKLKFLIVISIPSFFPVTVPPYMSNFCSESFLIIVPLADIRDISLPQLMRYV
jgi:hypothetical protein